MKRLLITGAAGHVGQALLKRPGINSFEVVACDLNKINSLPSQVKFRMMDVRDAETVNRVIEEFKPNTIIHLASVVTPPKGSGRKFAYEVDVTGTKHIVDACLEHKVDRLVVTSSGAAYGYHPENVLPLVEDDPVRGNYEFPYSYHKRLVEEFLEEVRTEHPGFEQVVLRVGTILGSGIENQITALFHKRRLLGILKNESPFVFIWDEDLAEILLLASDTGKPGIYNVAGDGALGITQIADILHKPIVRFPAWFLKAVLAVASPLGLSRYGPEQVRFLQYRPVLDNSRLKKEFGYVPEKSSLEAFQTWKEQAGI